MYMCAYPSFYISPFHTVLRRAVAGITDAGTRAMGTWLSIGQPDGSPREGARCLRLGVFQNLHISELDGCTTTSGAEDLTLKHQDIINT